MNVSGVVVKTLPHRFNEARELLRAGRLCDVHFDDGQTTIIVTLEGSSAAEETRLLREIQALAPVLTAEMVFSYAEDELNELRQAVESDAGKVPLFLEDHSLGAEEATYGGDVNRLMPGSR
jgi:nitrate reductase NapD